MSEPDSSPDVVRFGVFEVDLRARELRKQGVKIRLQEQPFRILELLLETPGQIVSRRTAFGRWAGLLSCDVAVRRRSRLLGRFGHLCIRSD